MFKRFAFAVITACCLIMLSACTNNMETIITDYNGNFSVYVPDTYNIQNEEFNPNNMLLSEYNVHQTTTLCLVAPDGGAEYEWKLTLVECAYEDVEEGEELILGVSKNLAVYLKDAGVIRWAEYELTLTVQDSNNNFFVDTAELNVY